MRFRLWLTVTFFAACTADARSTTHALLSENEPLYVRLLSYNTFLRPAEAEDPLAKPQAKSVDFVIPPSNPWCRAQKIAEHIAASDHDVVALQETDRDILAPFVTGDGPLASWATADAWSRPRSGLDEGCFAADGFHRRVFPFPLPWDTRCRPRGFPYFTTFGGNTTVLSRSWIPPMESPRNGCSPRYDAQTTSWTYCACSGDDCLANQGLVYAPTFIERGGQVIALSIITTHLDAYGSSEARMAQLATMRVFMESVICSHADRRQWPTIVLGDLNIPTTSFPDYDPQSEYRRALEIMTPWCLWWPRDVVGEHRGGWNDIDEMASTLQCEGDSLVSCRRPMPISKRLDYALILDPWEAPAWNVAVADASTQALADPACSFTNDGTMANPDGLLSDHRAVSVTLALWPFTR
jgi:hypothetical protein